MTLIAALQFILLAWQRSKIPGEDVTSAIPQRSEDKPMRILAWGFADSVNCNIAAYIRSCPTDKRGNPRIASLRSK